MNELEQHREEIDKIDQQLTRLFEERLEKVQKVGEYKKAHDLPIFDADREDAVISKNVERLSNPAFKQEIEDFYRSLMGITKASQEKLMDQDKV
ncbi:Chorismate mutase I [Alkalibacterium sp. AK22]|uniref:chorismate mutase n=1 Tax=Alkalibacterium sp. AK22 TaxID=1229520 RepID=UPI000452C7CE|nr:chorismate mutase [Alkalibacterium sp. AK22]EXJ22706.1 Chorismate mutase I [Alkalibacterium sp. AK22]